MTDENEEAADPLTIARSGLGVRQGASSRARRATAARPRAPSSASRLDPQQPVDHRARTARSARRARSSARPTRTSPSECPKNGTNGNDGYLDPANDSPNLRFFHQKERFGLFAGYPTSRYVRGLQKTTVPSVGLAFMGDTDHEHDSNGNYVGDQDAQANCVNPLFATNLPTSASADLCHLTPGPPHARPRLLRRDRRRSARAAAGHARRHGPRRGRRERQPALPRRHPARAVPAEDHAADGRLEAHQGQRSRALRLPRRRLPHDRVDRAAHHEQRASGPTPPRARRRRDGHASGGPAHAGCRPHQRLRVQHQQRATCSSRASSR